MESASFIVLFEVIHCKREVLYKVKTNAKIILEKTKEAEDGKQYDLGKEENSSRDDVV